MDHFKKESVKTHDRNTNNNMIIALYKKDISTREKAYLLNRYNQICDLIVSVEFELKSQIL